MYNFGVKYVDNNDYYDQPSEDVFINIQNNIMNKKSNNSETQYTN